MRYLGLTLEIEYWDILALKIQFDDKKSWLPNQAVMVVITQS